jgi:cell division transport system ATP-binding protein
MIQLSGVTKRYSDGFEALKEVNLNVNDGEFVVVTGHSGAGKSTLLKLIAGIELPTVGSVVVGGQNLNRLSTQAMALLRRNIGLVFQDHKLLFERSVFENVALPLAISGFSPKDAAKRVRAALNKVGLLDREKANPIQLSGGEQQRLCIARAIVNRPAILIADEPTGNLDSDYARTIMDMFKSFNQVGVTVLLSTHDAEWAERHQARKLTLARGKLAASAAEPAKS